MGLRRFGDRRSLIESSQVIEEMIQMAKDMQDTIALVLKQAEVPADDWTESWRISERDIRS